MSLLTYADARPYAAAIRRVIDTRRMPPWPADSPPGEFKNDPRLTDAQVRTIAAWIDAGAPEGETPPPPPPKFLDGWSARLDRPPDQIVETPFTFDVRSHPAARRRTASGGSARRARAQGG